MGPAGTAAASVPWSSMVRLVSRAPVTTGSTPYSLPCPSAGPCGRRSVGLVELVEGGERPRAPHGARDTVHHYLHPDHLPDLGRRRTAPGGARAVGGDDAAALPASINGEGDFASRLGGF